MRVAVIDDVSSSIEDIKALFALHLPDAEVFGFENADEYWAYLSEGGKSFDVMMLDIVLRDKNGIELANSFTEENPDLILVFISSDTIWFRDVYKVEHCYFLTKPIEPLYFADCIRRINELLLHRKLIINVNGETQSFSLSDICYIESALRRSVLHFSDGSTHTVAMKISDIESVLAVSSFIRVHKSFIVNIEKIRQIRRTKLFFGEDAVVNVSRPYVQIFRERYASYFGQLL